MFVAVNQHRRERLVPREVADLIKTNAGLLAVLKGRGNTRVTEAVTPHTQPTSDAEVQRALSGMKSVVTINFTSWNRTVSWLRQLEAIRAVA